MAGDRSSEKNPREQGDRATSAGRDLPPPSIFPAARKKSQCRFVAGSSSLIVEIQRTAFTLHPKGSFHARTHRAQPARRPDDAGGYLLMRGETTRPNRAFNATRWTYRAAGPPSRNGPPASTNYWGARRKCGDDDGRLLQAGDVFSGFSPKYPLVSTQDLFWFRGDNEKSPRLRRCQSSCRVSKGLQ